MPVSKTKAAPFNPDVVAEQLRSLNDEFERLDQEMERLLKRREDVVCKAAPSDEALARLHDVLDGMERRWREDTGFALLSALQYRKDDAKLHSALLRSFSSESQVLPQKLLLLLLPVIRERLVELAGECVWPDSMGTERRAEKLREVDAEIARVDSIRADLVELAARSPLRRGEPRRRGES